MFHSQVFGCITNDTGPVSEAQHRSAGGGSVLKDYILSHNVVSRYEFCLSLPRLPFMTDSVRLLSVWLCCESRGEKKITIDTCPSFFSYRRWGMKGLCISTGACIPRDAATMNSYCQKKSSPHRCVGSEAVSKQYDAVDLRDNL